MGIRLSENQVEWYQGIRKSGEICSLISWCSNIRFLIFRYPDEHINDD